MNWARYESTDYLIGATHQYHRRIGYQVSLLKEFSLNKYYSTRFKIEYSRRVIQHDITYCMPDAPIMIEVEFVHFITLAHSNKFIPISNIPTAYIVLEPRMDYIAKSDFALKTELIWGVNSGFGFEFWNVGNHSLLLEALYEYNLSSTSFWGDQPVNGNSIEVLFGFQF